MKTRLDNLLTLLSEDHNDSFVRFALAKEYEQLGDTEMALIQYQILKSADPDYVGLYYHLAKLHESMGEVSLALECYDAGIIVAKKLGDLHALSELNSAKLNLELEI